MNLILISNNTHSLLDSIESSILANSSKAKPQLKQHSEAKRKQIIQKIESDKKEEGTKENINVVVIGHVDSGKSTIMGHLLYLRYFYSSSYQYWELILSFIIF